MLSSAQAMVAQYRYDAYGNLLSSAGSLAAANVYRFSSKEFHSPSGLYYYGFRFYDPANQRWPNRDPLEEEGGINLYGYVGNNPISGIDPLGLWMWFWQPSVNVDGGTPDERRSVRQNLRQIYKTAHGNQLRKMIRKEGAQRCIHLNSMGRNGVPIANPDDIYVDPSSHPVIQTTAGPQPASTTRIIAHELGHSATGASDDGPNRMNNVNQNENPIVTHLSTPEPARTKY
jgi:RHS repeat-associated protein